MSWVLTRFSFIGLYSGLLDAFDEVFMMDGDRASVFKPDEVEVISAPEDAEERVYLVGMWVFTGSCYLTLGLRRLLPWGAVPVGTVLFGTVLVKLGKVPVGTVDFDLPFGR